MANHFQYRFTPAPKNSFTSPPIENYDLSGILLLKVSKLIIGYETKDKHGNTTIPHYHIYGETDYKEDSIRVKLRDLLNIPKTTQGKGSAYSALEFNKYSDPSPAYCAKWGDIKMSKGYTEAEIQEYIKIGARNWIKTEAPGEAARSAAEPRIEKMGFVEKLEKYKDYVLPKDKDAKFTYEMFKAKDCEYWCKEHMAVFPPDQWRYKKCAWAYWKYWILRKTPEEVQLSLERNFLDR